MSEKAAPGGGISGERKVVVFKEYLPGPETQISNKRREEGNNQIFQNRKEKVIY